VVELLKAVPDPILRYGYGRVAADRLGVPAQLLWQRLGVGRESLTQAVRPPERGGETPGRRAEQEALRLLLLAADRGEDLPAPADLPPEEAFYDLELRKFFRAFRTLYVEGSKPRLREVLEAVRDLADAGEKAAQLLLESEDSAGAPPLADVLRTLRRRWLRHRLREIQQEMSDAQRRGDTARLDTLLAEKTAVNAELHRPAVDLPSPGAE
jgi:DNA primase